MINLLAIFLVFFSLIIRAPIYAVEVKTKKQTKEVAVESSIVPGSQYEPKQSPTAVKRVPQSPSEKRSENAPPLDCPFPEDPCPVNEELDSYHPSMIEPEIYPEQNMEAPMCPPACEYPTPCDEFPVPNGEYLVPGGEFSPSEFPSSDGEIQPMPLDDLPPLDENFCPPPDECLPVEVDMVPPSCEVLPFDAEAFPIETPVFEDEMCPIDPMPPPPCEGYSQDEMLPTYEYLPPDGSLPPQAYPPGMPQCQPNGMYPQGFPSQPGAYPPPGMPPYPPNSGYPQGLPPPPSGSGGCPIPPGGCQPCNKCNPYINPYAKPPKGTCCPPAPIRGAHWGLNAATMILPIMLIVGVAAIVLVEHSDLSH